MTTPQKNTKISQKSDVFLRKILEKYFQLFSKLCSQIFFDFCWKKKKENKNSLFYTVLAKKEEKKKKERKKKKRNLPKWKIWVGRTCKISFFVT